MQRILHVVGARPNFMKIAPIMREMDKFPAQFEQLLIHTGQHYDERMSRVFFEELELPQPDINLEVGSGSHAWQTAQIMERFERIVLDYRPDWLVLPGDVNSTLACALVASKLGIRIAHVEAGLRSFDRTMPEEINRVVTDHLSELLFTTECSANENLVKEGISEEKIRFVGNVMIDTLVRLLPKAEARWPSLRDALSLRRFVLVTLHRPSNVDDDTTLLELVGALDDISESTTVVFPVHPRTQERLRNLKQLDNMRANDNLRLIGPLGYLDFLALQRNGELVITDSGGIQEETTYLGIPCLTARPSTERPVTITNGTNHLVESKKESLVRESLRRLNNVHKQPKLARPPLWDAQAARRIVHHILHPV
jgi:UDP-N-acetylglucosamine 2-epimerase (non-hydrolysing)